MTNPIEIRAFRISAVGFLMIGVLGFVFALLAHSQAIMLDGVYALISVIMTVLAARVARLVEAPSSHKFHFGYAHFEPLLNLVRGLLIFAVCLYAVVSTVEVLLGGGREIDAKVGVFYTALSAVWSLGVSVYQRRLARRLGSPALEVDARTWLVDGVLYVGETGGFIVYLLLERTSLAPLLKYADPIFVLLVVGLLMRVPIATIREAVREVLHRAPPPEVQSEVRRRLAEALAGLPVRKTHARMVGVGRFFFVLIHVVVEEGFGARPVSELDQIRRKVEQSLREIHPRVVLDVVFTADEYWATDGLIEGA
jgi:cation diffusion facilitator family transporter